ncbi:MAG: hypothetical protein P8170_20860 [Gemmatimonadota bacterium]|jgi:hypothetical protein
MPARPSNLTLWVAAVLIMLGAGSWQRMTGPTNPVRGTLEGAEGPVRYALIRSEETVRPARIALPDPGPGASGSVWYRRYPTGEPFTRVDLQKETLDGRTELVAYVPAQPAAGKVEYRVELEADGQVQRIPSPGQLDGDTIVMRFKDPIPLGLLIAHVTFMALAVLVGMRAGLGALLNPSKVQGLSWIALGLMSVGGMILGPIVQKYAFGAYWTGFPWGYDLTDNKTLIMWLVWILACGVLGWKRRAEIGARARAVVVGAAIVMTAVYLIPHSLRGSELDYGQLQDGAQAERVDRAGGGRLGVDRT